jgi:hypothetical protein
MTQPLPAQVAQAVATWPDPAQQAFHEVRQTILETAGAIPELEVIETLKWGQPSWLPSRPRVGSTLRAGWAAGRPECLSSFVHCQTTLSETMRTLYPDSFTFDGNRALHMALDAPLPLEALAHCADMTLTYHRKSA